MSGGPFFSRRRLLQAGIFLICLLFAGALATVRWTAGQQVPPPSLFVDPADLNLGTVWQQPRLQVTLPIRNPGDDVVVIDKLTPSCNCTGVSPESFSIGPGQTLPVQVTVDTARSTREIGAAEESFLVTLSARLSAPVEQALQWPLRGVVRRSLHVSPGAIILQGANEVISGVRSPTVVLEVTPQIEIAELKAEWTPTEADVDIQGPDANGHYRINYTPRSDLPRGLLATQLMLRTKLRDGTPGPSLEVPVRGMVVAPVRISPDRVTLPSRTARTDSSALAAPANLVPLDGREWLIRRVESVPDWLTVDTEFATGAVLLRAVGPAEGDQTASLLLDVESSQGQIERLTLVVMMAPVPKGRREFSTPSGEIQ